MEKKLLVALLILPLLTGCVTIKGTGTAKNDGGIYKSADGGQTWAQKVAIPEIGGKVSGMPNVTVETLEMDPQDHLALYLGTEKDGLFYTYDGGERWRHVTPLFASGKIPSIAVDYFNKCVIYVATTNKIYKSDDCSRSWRQIYFDTVEETLVTVVKTENYNKNVVYAGTSRGDVLKSLDYGATWTVKNRLKNKVVNIMPDKDDTRIIYVATDKGGLFKTVDGGENWSDINTDLKKYKGGNVYKFWAQDKLQPNTLILATNYGLLKSVNGGDNWEEIKLITPPNGANILSVAIDPSSSKTIYYGTDSTFYKTTDGG